MTKLKLGGKMRTVSIADRDKLKKMFAVRNALENAITAAGGEVTDAGTFLGKLDEAPTMELNFTLDGEEYTVSLERL